MPATAWESCPPRPRPPHPGAPCAQPFRRLHQARAPTRALPPPPHSLDPPPTCPTHLLRSLHPRTGSSGPAGARAPELGEEHETPRLASGRTRARPIALAAWAQLQTPVSPWGQRLLLALSGAPANLTSGTSCETRVRPTQRHLHYSHPSLSHRFTSLNLIPKIN
ncbi:uncharacterized protein LOC144581006 isoform X2 [Callithrix jacchus]